jgi:hypothetical protein
MRLDKNYGFAEANNIGIKKAISSGAEYVAILNNDTKADANWLGEMVKAMNADERIGSCACKILKYNDHRIIDTCGAGFYKNCMPFGRGSGENAEKYRTQEQVFGINGAAALLRTSMLKDVKIGEDYFDSDYFFYQEEFDLSWRALMRSWKCVYVPRSRVYHVGSATGSKMPNVVKYHLERNRIWTLVKDLQKELIMYAIPHIIFYELVSLPFYLFKGYFLAVVRGRVHALVGLAKMLKKRKIIQSRATARPDEIKKWMQPRKYL